MFRSVLRFMLILLVVGMLLVFVSMVWGESISGDVLAFASDGYNQESRIYMMDVDRRVRYLLHKDTDIDSPAWSPDGRYIAFVTQGGKGKGCVCVIDLVTRQILTLKDMVRLQDDPVWSPDSRYVTFSAYEQNQRDIFMVDVRTGAETNLTSSTQRQDYWPHWSPDGTQMIFMSYRITSPDTRPDIFVLTPDGSRVRSLIDSAGGDEWPQWSPDGSQIAFETDRDGNSEIYVLDVESGQVHNLTNSLGADYTPVWSPDSLQIAFAGYNFGTARMGVELHIMDSDGQNLRQLTRQNASIRNIHWSLDGRRLAFESVMDDDWDIYVINADGSGLERLSYTRPFDWIAGWRP